MDPTFARRPGKVPGGDCRQLQQDYTQYNQISRRLFFRFEIHRGNQCRNSCGRSTQPRYEGMRKSHAAGRLSNFEPSTMLSDEREIYEVKANALSLLCFFGKSRSTY